jgi:anti-sigma regulatory factor (Ser/Thr protein kinase)
MLRRELGVWLEHVGVPDEIRDDVILATHEAAANAIEHAELGTEIRVSGVLDDDKLLVIVTNSGVWKRPRSDDEMRGRGLTIMKALMSDLEIQVRDRRTVLRMRRVLSPRQPDSGGLISRLAEPARRPE